MEEIEKYISLLSLKSKVVGWWWHVPLTPSVSKQKQAELGELLASLYSKTLSPSVTKAYCVFSTVLSALHTTQQH